MTNSQKLFKNIHRLYRAAQSLPVHRKERAAFFIIKLSRSLPKNLGQTRAICFGLGIDLIKDNQYALASILNTAF